MALHDPHQKPDVPTYLQDTYWWAYLHPRAVHVFERQWLVNLILWGNFARLRDAALQAMDPQGRGIRGRVLQVACVYGNLTHHLLRRLRPGAHLDVVDVAPIQLENLQAKLKDAQQASLHLQDAADLHFTNASHHAVLLFFLLHEMPVEVRRKTLLEAWRVLKPGGKLVVVDYHRPRLWNPLRYVMVPVLRLLEPFAMDLWQRPITDWLPALDRTTMVHKQTYFWGLYQRVVVTKVER